MFGLNIQQSWAYSCKWKSWIKKHVWLDYRYMKSQNEVLLQRNFAERPIYPNHSTDQSIL